MLQAGSRLDCSPDTAPSGIPGPPRHHLTAAAYTLLGTESAGCRGTPGRYKAYQGTGYRVPAHSRRTDLGVVNAEHSVNHGWTSRTGKAWHQVPRSRRKD